MTDLTIDQEAQLFLELTAAQLTGVREGECLYCYVVRMLDEHGCDTSLRWARRFRDLRVPRATALEQPACRGVRRGSTQSCGVWERQRPRW